MSEPTGTLTFGDLITHVAFKCGFVSYGSDGTSAASIPTDAHDLELAKRIVNNAIRMFINDAPPNGWRWLKPVASLILWPDIAADSDNEIATAVYASPATTLTVPTAAFYPSMENKTITIDGTDFTIASYVSSTSITVTGDASSHVGDTWTINSGGAFTLPQTFGGQMTGHPTYAAGTNRGFRIEMCDESEIRELASNTTSFTGTPYRMATRITGTKRRYEALFYPTPDEVLTVDFPYLIHFDKLVDTTDLSPAPYGHDEALRAACLAVAEKELQDAIGMEWKYYREIALPNSYRVDALSAPKSLGYFGNGPMALPPNAWRDYVYQRPTVTVNL